jgi:hypothetical protein
LGSIAAGGGTDVGCRIMAALSASRASSLTKVDTGFVAWSEDPNVVE